MDMAIKLSGLFIGVFLRTCLPFKRKMKQGKIMGFDKRYFKQAIYAAGVAIVVTLLLIPQYRFDASPVLDFQSGVMVFATAFSFGFGANTLINELLKWQEGSNE